MNLMLDADEGILLQATEIEHYGEREDTLDELVLTNKNLIYSYEYKASMFAKAEQRLEKIPLTDIKVVNGKVQVMRIDHDDYGDVLQILFIDGTREYFSFFKPKKDIPLWINAITCAITGEDMTVIEESEEPKKKGLFASSKEKLGSVLKSDTAEKVDSSNKKSIDVNAAASSFTAGFMSMMDSAVQSIDSASKKISEFADKQVGIQNQPSDEPVEAKVQQVSEVAVEKKVTGMRFCSNCGEKLQEGSRFCHGCGARVGQPAAQTVKEDVAESTAQESVRTQEYAGTVIKCVHCGAVISKTTAVCPDCGMRITGTAALGSVQDFKNQLMTIEATRKKSHMGMFSLYAPADPADKQKVSLIQNYPIPSTVDDILEFMLLAVSNIDVKLSKNTLMNNSSSNLGVMAAEMNKIISDAWVSKMQQLYQKAEILFPNDPAFAGIQRIYFEKMAELKMKVK